MSYISDIFDRADLRSIRGFLLCGGQCAKLDEGAYEERLETAAKPLFEMIEKAFPKSEDRDRISACVQDYGIANQDVYMEIGLRCGAALALKLLAGLREE